jgi:hypothetical protein
MRCCHAFDERALSGDDESNRFTRAWWGWGALYEYPFIALLVVLASHLDMK